MQISEIRKITNSIKKRSKIENFIESEIFLNEFPEELRNFMIESINKPFIDLKKSLFQSIRIILRKYSNVELINKTLNYFDVIEKREPTIKKVPFTEHEIDDYDQLKEDLELFFNVVKKKYELKEFLIFGWNEFCINQGITCEIPMNTKILDIFHIEDNKTIEFVTPTFDILEPLNAFFDILTEEQIIIILIGNAIWKLSIDYFNSKARYRVLPHNGILIIYTYYDGILNLLRELKLCEEIEDAKALADTYYKITQIKECIDFFIEPWREIF
jgi:hypothetical protein